MKQRKLYLTKHGILIPVVKEKYKIGYAFNGNYSICIMTLKG